MEKFAEVTQETIFGTLWTRPGLDLKTRALICVISDTATGRYEELKLHLRFARNHGWTEDELSEALLHLTGYIGAPLVRGAMLTAVELFKEMQDGGLGKRPPVCQPRCRFRTYFPGASLATFESSISVQSLDRLLRRACRPDRRAPPVAVVRAWRSARDNLRPRPLGVTALRPASSPAISGCASRPARVPAG